MTWSTVRVSPFTTVWRGMLNRSQAPSWDRSSSPQFYARLCKCWAVVVDGYGWKLRSDLSQIEIKFWGSGTEACTSVYGLKPGREATIMWVACRSGVLTQLVVQLTQIMRNKTKVHLICNTLVWSWEVSLFVQSLRGKRCLFFSWFQCLQ